MSLRIGEDWIIDNDLPEDQKKDMHVFPKNDLRLHVLNRTCWCKPELTVHDEEGRVYSHNSMDGREAYERGERKFH